MEENPTTETRKPDVEARPETVKEPGLSEKLSIETEAGPKVQQEPKFRFYVVRPDLSEDVLWAAWERAQEQRSAGVDE